HSRYRFRSSRGGEPRTLLSPPSPVLLAAAASPEIYTLSLHDALPILSVRLAVKGFLQGRRRIQVMLLRAVEPIRQRRACHPRMERPDVVWDGIEENLHLLFVRCHDQVLIILQRTQVRVDGIQIHSAVPVIILRC